jgi:hypothetical protein
MILSILNDNMYYRANTPRIIFPTTLIGNIIPFDSDTCDCFDSSLRQNERCIVILPPIILGFRKTYVLKTSVLPYNVSS